MDIQQGIARLAEAGLNLFSSVPLDELPSELREFFTAQDFAGYSLCIVGHGGRRLWENLPRPIRGSEHPIDNYSLKQIHWFIREVLRDHEAVIAFPGSDRLLPLQRLGRYVNMARPSLVGLDINSEFGVWFAYRAVFLTRVKIPRIVYEEFQSPCATCVEKPCIRACPAGAVQAQQFALKSCMEFRIQKASPCADRCHAREACPIRAEHRYSPEQIQYHMGHAQMASSQERHQ